ncbi:MAG: flippase [Thermoleophilia bacterium]
MSKPDRTTKALTSGSLLARNSLFNLIGQGIPLLVALFAIPLLIHGLGTDRFGVLTLAWMVIGYFSVFDLGLGRALTQLVAKKLGAGEEVHIPPLVWTALALMGVLGIIGALLMTVISSWLVRTILNVPAGLQQETLQSFYVLALSIPIVISTAGLRGIMEAYQRFGQVNAIRVPMGLFTFLGPLVVLPFSNSLYYLVLALVAGRVVAWVAHLVLCLRLVPAIKHGVGIRREMIYPLVSSGGWMTVSNAVGPLITYLDRLLIGATISMTAVAYYTTPSEMIIRLWILPDALVGVLFPVFSMTFVQDRKRAARFYLLGVKAVLFVMFPVVLFIITFAHEGLSLWLGQEFSEHSARVLQWLAIGVFVNGLARVPFALIQGAGRADITAKLHLFQLPFYVLAMWWALASYGITGAAIVWAGRIIMEAVIFFVIVELNIVRCEKNAIQKILLGVGLAIFAMISGIFITDLIMRVVFLGVFLLVFMIIAWHILLNADEKYLFWEYVPIRGRHKILK